MEATRLAEQGVKEILVIGQDTTSYGWDLEVKAGLHDLFDELDKIDKIEEVEENVEEIKKIEEVEEIN